MINRRTLGLRGHHLQSAGQWHRGSITQTDAPTAVATGVDDAATQSGDRAWAVPAVGQRCDLGSIRRGGGTYRPAMEKLRQLFRTTWKRLLTLRMVAWSPVLVVTVIVWWVVRWWFRRRRESSAEVRHPLQGW